MSGLMLMNSVYNEFDQNFLVAMPSPIFYIENRQSSRWKIKQFLHQITSRFYRRFKNQSKPTPSVG